LANAGILRFSFDRFTSSLKVIKVKEVFPYEGIEYMGWRFNDNLGGGGEGRANYWLIKGLGGGEVREYEVVEGGELRVEIPEDTTKINLGLVRDNVKKSLGSIFTNMSKEELVSFLAGKGLELVGFVEGVWERSANGDWVRPSVREGIRYFVPLLDKEGYIISDWRGVPRVIYDEFEKEIWRGEFGPFGEPLYERGVVSNYIPFRLYGMYKDIETGLYYNARRYYDWRVGRYLQPDPVSDLNLYAYVSNSPYDVVDPLGMFKTTMRPLGFPHHVGYPHHEKITEDAVNNLGYSILRQFGPAEDYWSFKDSPWLYSVAQCRGYKNKLAQGANRADCFYEDDSSYHCDNDNFEVCRKVTERVEFPKSRGVVACVCVANCDQPLPNPPPKPPSNPPPTYPPPDGGGPGKGEIRGCSSGKDSQPSSYPPPSGPGESEKRGCSKGSQTPPYRSPIGPREDNEREYSVSTQRLKEKTLRPILQCSFRVPEDYETLGRYLHPVQDFWAHSNAVFVSICGNRICASSFLGICLDWECAEYEVVSYYILHKIPDSLFHFYYLTSGLYGGSKWEYSWSASDDISCQKAISFIGSRWPPCDLQAQVFTHCMLNKDDNVGPDRDCMGACDQGDWPGDCGGDDNVQRYAFWDARNRALASTVHYLFSFCQEAPNLCY